MTKVDFRTLDHLKGAEIETKMWRSYYNHQFVRLGWYLVVFMRTVFMCGWILAFRLAWHAGYAAAIYRLKKGHENYPSVLKSLVKFYKIGSNHSIEPFDYRKGAELELEWWDIHRYPQKYDKSLERSIAEAAAIPYRADPKDLMEYAAHRTKAAKMLTHEGDKHEVKNDWPQIEKLLYATWESFDRAVRPKK